MDIDSIAKFITTDPNIINEDFERAISAVKLVKGKVDSFLRKNPHKIPRDQMLFVVATMWNNSKYELNSSPEEETLILDLLGNTFRFDPKKIDQTASRLDSEIQNFQASRNEKDLDYSRDDWLKGYGQHTGVIPQGSLGSPPPDDDADDFDVHDFDRSGELSDEGERNKHIGIEDADWSVRATRNFETNGIKTLGELANLSADDILSMRNAGRTTLREIRGKLKWYGLKLRGDNEEPDPSY